jgi:lipopolysaccharide transport system ATP-binding protein
MSKPAIVVENLGKQYQIGSRYERKTLREALLDTAAAPLRRLRRLSGHAADDNIFWALRNVSFEVQPGEVVGIIGRNGAGKSTLLKILSRISEPTEGQALIRGRVGSLLEVGTGFHSELTGRENIYLNGSILGMSRTEINRKFDEIVDFAGVDKFIDTPVKRYSTGMKVRLGFAVAAHLEPEILIVDEVLAVGDAEFQRRCIGKMQDVARVGRTVFFVSHNMAAVRSLCDVALHLERGKAVDRGATAEVIDRYLADVDGAPESIDLQHRHDGSGNRAARISSVVLYDRTGRRVTAIASGDPLRIRVSYSAKHALAEPCCQIALYNEWGLPITFLSTQYTRDLLMTLPSTGVIECYIPALCVAVGRYYVDLCLTSDGVTLDHLERIATLSVRDDGFFPSGTTPPASYGALLSRHHWNLLS